MSPAGLLPTKVATPNVMSASIALWGITEKLLQALDSCQSLYKLSVVTINLSITAPINSKVQHPPRATPRAFEL